MRRWGERGALTVLCSVLAATTAVAQGIAPSTTDSASGFSKAGAAIDRSISSFSNKMKSAFKPEETTESSEIPSPWLNSKKAKDPEPDLYTSFAELQLQQGNFPAAEEQFKKALNKDPKYAPALAGMARLYQQTGQHERALEMYRRALEANPRDASLHNDVGVYFLQSGRTAEAIREFEQAIAIDPKSQLYRNNIARPLIGTNRHAEAFSHLSAVYEPAVAYYNMGYLLQQKGDNSGAFMHFRKAVELQPDFVEASQWCATLERQFAPRAPGLGFQPRIAQRPQAPIRSSVPAPIAGPQLSADNPSQVADAMPSTTPSSQIAPNPPRVDVPRRYVAPPKRLEPDKAAVAESISTEALVPPTIELEAVGVATSIVATGAPPAPADGYRFDSSASATESAPAADRLSGWEPNAPTLVPQPHLPTVRPAPPQSELATKPRAAVIDLPKPIEPPLTEGPERDVERPVPSVALNWQRPDVPPSAPASISSPEASPSVPVAEQIPGVHRFPQNLGGTPPAEDASSAKERQPTASSDHAAPVNALQPGDVESSTSYWQASGASQIGPEALSMLVPPSDLAVPSQSATEAAQPSKAETEPATPSQLFPSRSSTVNESMPGTEPAATEEAPQRERWVLPSPRRIVTIREAAETASQPAAPQTSRQSRQETPQVSNRRTYRGPSRY